MIRPPVVAILGLMLVLAACITGGDLPSDCSAASVERTVTLQSNAKLEPGTIDVCRNQQVTLKVTVEADGVLHLHGYDDVLAATSVHAGSQAVLAFPAAHVGQWVIELHVAGSSTGIGSGVFTVHEP